MDPLTQILDPKRLTAIVDVGANPIDGDPPYKAMLAAGLCEVTGFEPQAHALAKLQQSKGPRERYLPYALGDGTQRTLHVCELEGMTSLLEPDPAHLALFNLFPIWGQVKAQIPVTTKKLDDVAEIAAMDFLKMDVQGGEREVLAHGRARLKDRSFLCSPLQEPAALRRNRPRLAGTRLHAPLRHRHQDLAAGADGGAQ
jgi:FkbM family methyltransferase